MVNDALAYINKLQISRSQLFITLKIQVRGDKEER